MPLENALCRFQVLPLTGKRTVSTRAYPETRECVESPWHRESTCEKTPTLQPAEEGQGLYPPRGPNCLRIPPGEACARLKVLLPGTAPDRSWTPNATRALGV